MQSSSAPNKFIKPFAQGDSARVEIPVTTVDPTRASQTLGFPPLTMQPPEVGGVPPQGEDFNGAMNQIARVAWWVANLGSSFVYDAAFAANADIGGYPKGSQLLRADLAGLWLNGAENNATNPDDNAGAAVGWLPGYTYGAASIAVTTATTVYPVNAAHRTLILTGTLTANSVVNLPAWTYDWYVIDNTTRGGFTLTVKTASGTGVAIASGAQCLHGDGTNIVQLPASIAQAALSTQPITLGQGDARYAPIGGASGVVGAYRNLKITSIGLNNYNTVVTADEVVLENSSNAYITQRAVNKTINANGTVGAPLSIMSTRAASTWYYVWLWYNVANGLTATLDVSSTAPTAPTGYVSTDYKARMPGARRTDASGSTYLLQLLTANMNTQYVPLTSSNVAGLPQMATGSAGSTTTPTWVAVAVGAFVPPTATIIAASLGINTAAGTVGMAAPNNSYGAPTSTTNPAPLVITAGYNSGVANQVTNFVLESTNIYWASGTGGILACFGWSD